MMLLSQVDSGRGVFYVFGPAELAGIAHRIVDYVTENVATSLEPGKVYVITIDEVWSDEEGIGVFDVKVWVKRYKDYWEPEPRGDYVIYHFILFASDEDVEATHITVPTRVE